MRFIDIVIRQAHPGPNARPYHTFEQKLHDAERYKREEGIPWPVLVDDLEGTVHQAYGGLADPTYLIDRDGRVAFYNLWTHAPTLYEAITALMRQGGRGVVRGGIDPMLHVLPALTDGWNGIRRGLPQSVIEMELAAPGSGIGLWLGHKLRPVLAPVTLRARPLPASARLGLAAGLGLALALAVRRATR